MGSAIREAFCTSILGGGSGDDDCCLPTYLGLF